MLHACFGNRLEDCPRISMPIREQAGDLPVLADAVG